MLAMMTTQDVPTTPNMNQVTTAPRATSTSLASKWTSKPAASLYAAECPYQEVTDSSMWAAYPAKTCPRKGPWHSKLRLTKKSGYISHFCTTCVKELWREEVDDYDNDAYGDYDSEYEY